MTFERASKMSAWSFDSQIEFENTQVKITLTPRHKFERIDYMINKVIILKIFGESALSDTYKNEYPLN